MWIGFVMWGNSIVHEFSLCSFCRTMWRCKFQHPEGAVRYNENACEEWYACWMLWRGCDVKDRIWKYFLLLVFCQCQYRPMILSARDVLISCQTFHSLLSFNISIDFFIGYIRLPRSIWASNKLDSSSVFLKAFVIFYIRITFILESLISLQFWWEWRFDWELSVSSRVAAQMHIQ